MLEGNSFESWYDWKKTVGPIEEREPIWNVWGYYQTLGIGYFEYLQFCEDLGAKPVPVFLAGLTCQLRPPASCAAMDSLMRWLSNSLASVLAASDVATFSLCAALAEGMILTEALHFAAKASAISVTRAGAQPSIPTRAEVDNF
jgi:hypothetical protein